MENKTEKTKELSYEEEIHKQNSSNAMVFGIVGDVLVWYPIFGIAGLILSILALIKSSNNKNYAKQHMFIENGMNKAAHWCGIGGIIVGSVMTVLYLCLAVMLVLFSLNILQSNGILDIIFTK